MDSDSSPVDGIFFSFVIANGITHRLASTRKKLMDKEVGASMARANGQSLVLFLHGFPESWYSWRHQLLFLKDKPYLGVAPDMRGYGSTSQPESVEEYTQPVLACDVLGIANALGYERFFVVGHDWGSALAWNVALLYPECVIGVCGMSVPYAGTPKAGFLSLLQHKYGESIDPTVPREVRQRARFHYILHHCLPRATEEYNRNAREVLYRLYANRNDCALEEGTPEYDIHGLMFPPSGDEDCDRFRPLDATTAPGLWLRLPRPTTLPPWMNENDFEYFLKEFLQAGFGGGLRWYQALDRNYELMKALLQDKNGKLYDKITRPGLFLVGADDDVIRMYGGTEAMVSKLKHFVTDMTREPVLFENSGHWIQQELFETVNFLLLEFFETVTSRDGWLPSRCKL